ncbi:hypothetical protein NL676_036032 [Syzygium grande]|nr:hypothetical protein NL676_036032 [Syzygium grande]
MITRPMTNDEQPQERPAKQKLPRRGEAVRSTRLAVGDDGLRGWTELREAVEQERAETVEAAAQGTSENCKKRNHHSFSSSILAEVGVRSFECKFCGLLLCLFLWFQREVTLFSIVWSSLGIVAMCSMVWPPSL